ncbi:MAG: glutathione peroxidase [Hyphomonadaceae bacterium]|nr:glutathione peroxidase [Hyphomonadaceae bacterium]
MKRFLTTLAFAALMTACGQSAAPPAKEENTAAAAPSPEDARAAAVAEAVAAQRARFDAAPAPSTDANSAYQFQFEGLSTPRVPMTAFQGEVVLVVNTASKCGLTPQYEGLQQIYSEYHGQGFEVLGVPANNFMGQEPGSAEEIRDFCTLNFGVTFPMTAKQNVLGDDAHPFYRWAKAEIGDDAVPKWNFHKILVGRDGRIIRAFPSRTTPDSEEVRAAITAALAAPRPT